MAIDQDIKKAIDDLRNEIVNRLIKIEKNNPGIDHQHTGIDSMRVRFINLSAIVYKEATINPGNLADGTGETESVAVTGANLGDFVIVSAPYDLRDITVTAYVQAIDVIEIRIQNESGNTINLASGLWRFLVIKKMV